MVNATSILDFWFAGIANDAECASRQAPLWWQKDERADCSIAARFGETLEIAAAGGMDEWQNEATSRLALIILLDQFSRNIYRGTSRAFAQDARALTLCLEGLQAEHDQALRPIERLFFYLPLEHSESIDMQNRSVAVFKALLEAAPEDAKPAFANFLDYAEQHRAVIENFGRFPHRNEILARESTPEEIAFLEQPDSSF